MKASSSDQRFKSVCSESDNDSSLELGLVGLRSFESQNKSKSEDGEQKHQNYYTLGFTFIFLSI